MQTNTKSRVYAGFFVRLAAFLVDLIIVNTGLLLIRVPMWILATNSPNNILVRDFIFQYSVVDIVVYLVNVAYFILQTYYSGATLGKKMFQIRVVSTEERKMTWFEVIYRETIGRFLSGIVMNLGYLMILVDKENRSLHDILSDTHVVYYHEKKVYVHAPVHERNMNVQPNVPPMGPNMGQPNVPPMGPNMGQSNVPPMGPNMGQPNVPPMGPNMGQPNVPPMGPSTPQGDFVQGVQESPQIPFVSSKQSETEKTEENVETEKKEFSMPAGYFSMETEENHLSEDTKPEGSCSVEEANTDDSKAQKSEKTHETME